MASTIRSHPGVELQSDEHEERDKQPDAVQNQALGVAIVRVVEDAVDDDGDQEADGGDDEADLDNVLLGGPSSRLHGAREHLVANRVVLNIHVLDAEFRTDIRRVACHGERAVLVDLDVLGRRSLAGHAVDKRHI